MQGDFQEPLSLLLILLFEQVFQLCCIFPSRRTQLLDHLLSRMSVNSSLLVYRFIIPLFEQIIVIKHDSKLTAILLSSAKL